MRSSPLLAWLAAGLLALGALEIFALRLLEPLENRLLDAFVRAHAARLAPDPDIVLVDIDEKSLNDMQEGAGRFPWPREVYGDVVNGIAGQRARAIVFDIMFSEPDRYRPESDKVFIEAVSRHPNVFFPLQILDDKLHAKGEPVSVVAPMLGLVRGPGADPKARIAVVPPLALPPALWRTGSPEDADA